MEKINLELEFKTYLERVKLNPNTMSAIQMQETKRAFFGGIAQMWKLFINISELPEENFDTVFADIEDQIAIFWLDETINTETRNKQ